MIDDVECLALVDSGAQISTITIGIVKQLELKIYQLDRILKVETTGGGDIPYTGYVEVNLKIPEIKAFSEDMLMLVIEDSMYAQWVAIQPGILHIDRALYLISEKEITQLNTKCKWSKITSLLTGKMAWVEDKSEKTFSPDKVDGTVKAIKTVRIPLFSTIQVHGIMKINDHDKRVNLIVEPKNNGCNPSVVVVPSYANLRPGTSKVDMNLRNLTSRNIKMKEKSRVAQEAAANEVPLTLTPKIPQESEKQNDKRVKSPDKISEVPIKSAID